MGLSEPNNIHELFEAADKIKSAGYTAIALGGEPWQVNYVFQGILLGLSGPDIWNTLFSDRAPEAIDNPLIEETFDLMRKATGFIDTASPGRSWDETAKMITANTAGMQFMGDWVRGEFVAAGAKEGENYGCFIAPGGAPAYTMSIDLFVFPNDPNDDQQAGQDLLAETLMDPQVMADFSNVKGSIPARMDVDTDSLSECAIKGLNIIAQPGASILPMSANLPSDVASRVTDLISTFWNTPDYATEDAVAEFRAILSGDPSEGRS